MTIVDMLQQSLFLTLLGMGVVFAFLIILIVFMILSHKVLHALNLDKEEKIQPATPVVVPAASGNEGAVIAAIATAIHEKELI